MPTVEQIDRCLPQTQCTKCSYPGCLEYAQAIDEGLADINQCPPGGSVTIRLLAELLERPVKPLNTKFGKHTRKHIAKIVEKDCIGCMLCIKACPVDAIIGSNKMMHSVIDIECTGCELCLPPCPMDCIEMIRADTLPAQKPWEDYSYISANQSRNRRKNRQLRLTVNQAEKNSLQSRQNVDRKKVIEDSLRRSRLKSA
jgi:electron transport complex protein RnfB